MPKTSYVIALGSNRRHHRHGGPAGVLSAALAALTGEGIEVAVPAPVFRTDAIGPAGRAFANSAAILVTELTPPEMIRRLKALERGFGRRPGRRWGPRVLDLDIVLWSGGMWAGPGLAIPHPGFRERRFVLDPVAAIAADWRDPVTGLYVRHLRAKAMRRRSTCLQFAQEAPGR